MNKVSQTTAHLATAYAISAPPYLKRTRFIDDKRPSPRPAVRALRNAHRVANPGGPTLSAWNADAARAGTATSSLWFIASRQLSDYPELRPTVLFRGGSRKVPEGQPEDLLRPVA